jgi:hypothetical protein
MVEVVGIAGQQRKIVRQRGRGDQHIHRSRTAGLALMGTGGGVDAAVGAGSGGIERQRPGRRTRSMRQLVGDGRGVQGPLVAPSDPSGIGAVEPWCTAPLNDR